MWKNRLDRDRPRVTMQYDAGAVLAGYMRLQHVFRICNTYYFRMQQYLYERASVLRYKYVVCLA